MRVGHINIPLSLTNRISLSKAWPSTVTEHLYRNDGRYEHFLKCLQCGAVYAGVLVPWTMAVIARDRGVISQTDSKQELSS